MFFVAACLLTYYVLKAQYCKICIAAYIKLNNKLRISQKCFYG